MHKWILCYIVLSAIRMCWQLYPVLWNILLWFSPFRIWHNGMNIRNNWICQPENVHTLSISVESQVISLHTWIFYYNTHSELWKIIRALVWHIFDHFEWIEWNVQCTCVINTKIQHQTIKILNFTNKFVRLKVWYLSVLSINRTELSYNIKYMYKYNNDDEKTQRQ